MLAVLLVIQKCLLLRLKNHLLLLLFLFLEFIPLQLLRYCLLVIILLELQPLPLPLRLHLVNEISLPQGFCDAPLNPRLVPRQLLDTALHGQLLVLLDFDSNLRLQPFAHRVILIVLHRGEALVEGCQVLILRLLIDHWRRWCLGYHTANELR